MAARFCTTLLSTVAISLLPGAPGALGMDAVPTSPEEVEGLIKRQMAVVAKLARTAGIRPE